MSLKSFLGARADVRRYLRSAFRKPRIDGTPEVILPPLTKNHSLVGTAFDYLARLMIQHVNPRVVEPKRWVAESAIRRLPPGSRKKGVQITRTARALFGRFLDDSRLTDDLICASVRLAQLDVIFRTGRYFELLEQTPRAEDISDLRGLVEAMPLPEFSAESACLLNPDFGKASVAIGGADADVILDNTLIDLKTTIMPPVRGQDFDQLLGYYLLYRIGGVTGIKTHPPVVRVGFYYARRAFLISWSVEELIRGVPLTEVVSWFRQRLDDLVEKSGA